MDDTEPPILSNRSGKTRSDSTAPVFARQSTADNTLKAYANDWSRFSRWCRLRGVSELPPSANLIALYLADVASPQGKQALSVASIERRLSGLVWGYAQRGTPLDRNDRQIVSALANIRRLHARPPAQKEAIRPEDLIAMLDTLSRDLRGLRDRAILLIGFAGGLRRSEIVSIDLGTDVPSGSDGWITLREDGVAISLRSKAGWREVEIARGPSDHICPVHALTQWLHFARIDAGPVFVGVTRDGRKATGRRLGDKHVARLVKQTAKAAGLRPDLPETQRIRLYSGHSLRSGRARTAAPNSVSH